jgi:isobutyryl-CoA dehydrogenase
MITSFPRLLSKHRLLRVRVYVLQSRLISTGSPFDPSIGLSEDQLLYLRTAQSFADAEFAPYASSWDQNRTFPVEPLRKAAALGFGGLYVDPVYGGSGMSRHDGSLIVESLAAADASTTAYLTIHNMVRVKCRRSKRSSV